MGVQLQPGVFWRIVDESGAGPDSVTLVFQTDGEEPDALQLETDVITANYLSQAGREHIDVAWTESDFELFQTLLSKQFPENSDGGDGFRLDLSDDDVQDTIAVLAAARFSTEQDGRDWITCRHWHTLHPEYEVGDMVALPTDEGFCLGVLVDIDATEARVVLLECLDPEHARHTCRLHELIRVERGDLLPETFGNVMVSESDTLH